MLQQQLPLRFPLRLKLIFRLDLKSILARLPFLMTRLSEILVLAV